MPLTPVEVDSLIQGAQPARPLADDASTRPTVETFRPAMGSTPIPTVAAERLERPAPAPPSDPAAAPAAAPRGPRRTRETLRADQIRPPRKR